MSLYQDKQWLYDQYVVKGIGSTTLARSLEVDFSTIIYWLKKFQIFKHKNKKLYCSRKNCEQKIEVGRYCLFHSRMHNMMANANRRHSPKISMGQIENLYHKYFSDSDQPTCQGCDKTMILSSHYGPLTDVLSLQHWEDGSLGFLCHSCNAKHGNYPEVFNIAEGYKLCTKCSMVKPHDEFYYNKTAAAPSASCKECVKERMRVKRTNV